MSSRTRSTSKALSEDTKLAWLRLYRSDNVGPVTFRHLMRRYGNAQTALEALPELSARGGRRVTAAKTGVIRAEFDRAERMGASFVCMGEPDFPHMLADDEYSPPILAIMGRPDILARPAVGIVGARNASLSGIKLTRRFAAELGDAGYVVVSGLARGIDAAAHEASIGTGTVGVFAGGLDMPYPPENRPLMRRIVDEGGCLVSERPFGWEPRAKDFPRRNRIVASLSHGLLVVEAALRSGSLISARLANELGRLVFAVPGSPLDPRAGGCNSLLKNGALLATEGRDIVEALQPLAGAASYPQGRTPSHASLGEPEPETIEPISEDGARERVLEALGPTPTAIGDLVDFTGLSAGAAQLVLVELDLAGRLERHRDGTVSLQM